MNERMKMEASDMRRIIRHHLPKARRSIQLRVMDFKSFKSATIEDESYRVKKLAELEVALQAIINVMEEPAK